MSQTRLVDRIKDEAKKPKEARDEKALFGPMGTVIDECAVDSDGNNALILAIKENFFDTANLLIEKSDLNVNHKNNQGETALAWAICRRNEKIINALLSKNAAVDSIDNGGTSILREVGISYPELIPKLIPKIIERLHLIDAKSEVKSDVKEVSSSIQYISHLIAGIVAATRGLVAGKDFYKQALEEFAKAKEAIPKPLSGDTELFFTTLDKLPKGRKEDFTCNALEVISQFYDLAKSKDTWIAHGSVAILYLLVRDFQDIIIKGPEGKLLNNLLKDIYSDSSIKLSPHIFNQKESFEGYANVSIASFKRKWATALSELTYITGMKVITEDYIATAYLQLALCEEKLAKDDSAHDKKRIEYLRKALISFNAVQPKTKPVVARMEYLTKLPELKADEEIGKQLPSYRLKMNLDVDFERVKEEQKKEKPETIPKLREYRDKYKALVKGYCELRCELRDEKKLEECIKQLELLRDANLFLGEDLFNLNEIILMACEAMLTRFVELNDPTLRDRNLGLCEGYLLRLEEKSLHPSEHQRLKSAIEKSKRFLSFEGSYSKYPFSYARDEVANKGYVGAFINQLTYHYHGRNPGRVLLNSARILIAKHACISSNTPLDPNKILRESRDPVAKWYLNLVEDLDAINKDFSRIDINPTTLILLMLEKETDPNIIKAITRSLTSSRVTDQVKRDLLNNSDVEQRVRNAIVAHRASKGPAVGEDEAKKTQGWGEYLGGLASSALFWRKTVVPPPEDKPIELQPKAPKPGPTPKEGE